MAISFLCTGCSKQLQVPDDAAGGKAKCPACGAVMVVPEVVSAEEVHASGDDPSQAGAAPQGAGLSGYPYGGAYDGGAYGYRPDSPFMPEFQPRRFSIGEAWDDTWLIYKSRLWPIVGVTLLAFAINVGAGMAAGIFEELSVALLGEAGLVLQFFANIAQNVFNMWISIGMFMYLLNMVSDRNPNINDLFLGARFLLRYIGASILFACGGLAIIAVFAIPVAGIFIAEGNQFNQQGVQNASPVFLGIGGTVAAVGFFCLLFYYLTFALWPLLLIDRNLGVMDSLGMSAKLMRGNRWNYFLMQFGVGFLAFLFTIVTCGIGFIFAIPFLSLLTVVLYYHIAGLPIGRMYQEF